MTELERALRDQLVGKYMRHSDCKAGCLLLTWRGEKKSWGLGGRLTFGQLVERLREKAKAVEGNPPHDVRLGVFGLDLTGA